jgi:hypothetical protein
MPSKWKILAILLSLCLPQCSGANAETDNPDGYRVSDPVVHGNLAIYFVHGKSRGGPVPLALQEALAKKVITVHETGQVNELQVENIGGEEIFIQSGDIVKGGQQDRVLSVSMLLPPHSGAIPIDSFCVESGRWSARGIEDARTFSSATAALPSRAAKLAIAGALTKRADGGDASVGARQQEVWNSVAQIQKKLSANLGAPVAAPRSRTSLQLTLEDNHLAAQQAEYIASLQANGEQSDDIVGYVFAVNGKINSADIYPSNGLFRKMWPKLLRTSVTEAIGDRTADSAPAPPTTAVSGFIGSADSGHAVEAKAGEQMSVRMRESNRAMVLEARPANAPVANWVYRSYLAK